MELSPDFQETYFECVNVSRCIQKNTELCLICQVDETEDGIKPWDRYKLRCGHVGHSRCMRRWCHYKNGVHCPLCGFVDMNDMKNMFCFHCKKFGHNMDIC